MNLNKIKYGIFFIFLILWQISFAQEKTIKIDNGVLNISDWNFTKDGNIKLSGKWEFYWSKLYTSTDLNDSTIKPDAYAPVPGVWSKISINGKNLPDTGFATYRLIINSDTSYSVGTMFFFKEIMTAYKVYFNGELISQVGKVGKNSKEAISKVRIDIQSVIICKGANELIVQISNYDHRTNAFDNAPILGEENNIDKVFFKTISFDLIIFGLLMIMAFYHLGLFFLRKKNKVALTFAMFAFVLAIRTIATNNFILSYIYPQTSWKLIYFFSYSTFYLGVPMFFLYFKQVFEIKKYKFVFISVYALSAIFMLTLALPSLIYTKLLIYFQAISLLFIIFTVYLLIGFVIKKRNGSVILFVSILIFSSSVINDFLYYDDIIKSTVLVPYGIFVLLLGQALTLGRIFTHAFEENEDLTEKLEVQNKNLEKIVEERTIKLKEQNEELTVAEEELRQTLDEFRTLNRQFELKNNELNKYFTAIEQSNVAILITDLTPKIEYVNPYFTTITGYTKEEVIGKNPKILNSGKNSKELYHDLWSKILNGQVWRGEFINKAKDGSNFIEKTIISPIFDTQGKTISYISIKEDITELRKKEVEIVDKNKKLEQLNDEMNKILNNLISSLNYAKRIQRAVFPSPEELSQIIGDYFLYYKSREIVGGDFYFVRQLEKYKIIAIGDCTGHGVPGGFLTILATTLLIESTNKVVSLQPAEILEYIRREVKRTFSTEKNQIQDGFDIGIVIWNTQTNEFAFSGANIPAYIFRDNELVEFKAINNPMGFYPLERNFVNHTFKIKNNDILYLASDGIIDQFNKENVKFTKKRFKDLLMEIGTMNTSYQKNTVEKVFLEWKKDTRQIDDITILGIKFKIE